MSIIVKITFKVNVIRIKFFIQFIFKETLYFIIVIVVFDHSNIKKVITVYIFPLQDLLSNL